MLSVLAVRRFFILATGWLFLWGCGVLLARGLRLPEWRTCLWGGAVLPLLAVPALLIERRRIPSASALRALLDLSNNSGGLVMAQETYDIGPWAKTIGVLSCPPVMWRWKKTAGYLAAGCLFAASSFLMPQRYIGTAASSRLHLAERVSETEEKIDLFEKEEIITPEEARRVKEQLHEIEAAAKGEDPATTWEALDHLAAEVSQTAKAAAEKNVSSRGPCLPLRQEPRLSRRATSKRECHVPRQGT